ncbi:redoxin domain-containing protein [uncultured Rhodoblastus sp.]|uniref:redoxin domain-containing protein n=1 Tax=uncultured Rhodoblastus sp. TaxID=543037 RepID=UPI0025CCC5E9|nr:redoxin domain-containing protein [uncultured Rhodoblastus sp.]
MAEKSFAEKLEATTEEARRMDAPLSVRLRAVADKVRELSPPFADIVDRMVARLAENGVGLAAPRPGEPMPHFLLPDEAGRLVSLASLLERGPVVVSFNRGHWCPYCQLNVDALARAGEEIQALGAQIVAISPETSEWAAQLKSYAQAPFHILSDLDGAYALELGLLFWVGEEKKRAMAGGGFDITLYQANDTWMLPVPATFVIDSDGVILARYIDPDYRRRMEVEDLLEALRSDAKRRADQAR